MEQLLKRIFNICIHNIIIHNIITYSGSVLEKKGIRVTFENGQKRGQKMFKKGRIFENLGKNVQNLKTF